MSIIELGPVIFGSTLDLSQWLQRKGLLASSQDCGRCSVHMSLVPRTQQGGSMDGYTWRCPQCKTMKSIRHGSFFSKSKLPLFKWLLLMQLWSRQHPVCDAADNADISEKTTIDTYQFFRDVCTTKLLQAPIKLGGPGIVVQIDESLFNHKPKVSALLCNVVLVHIKFPFKLRT